MTSFSEVVVLTSAQRFAVVKWTHGGADFCEATKTGLCEKG